ncbi:hypothetical protein [Lacrimispora celerecrescens]|uniref:hypothetical protein n=1 Tax=Lacrimispora celerecrescens TaxID=29354 RepID=UPI002E8E261F|nr:hypothetical protein [Lacrimispora celerecrescens]
MVIIQDVEDFRKEEIFFLLLEQLIKEYTDVIQSPKSGQSLETKAICEFLEKNYVKNITLNELSNLTGLSKYYLLRYFTKQVPVITVATSVIILREKITGIAVFGIVLTLAGLFISENKIF